MVILNYFYENDIEQFLFYRVPKVLFEYLYFRCVSFEARTFFVILLAQVALSRKNKWLDDGGRVYIYFTQQSAMKITGYGHNKVARMFLELESVGLIERKKQGQGKPARIYVKNFTVLLENAGKAGEKVKEAQAEVAGASEATDVTADIQASPESVAADTPVILREEQEEAAEVMPLSETLEMEPVQTLPVYTSTEEKEDAPLERTADRNWKAPMAVPTVKMELPTEQPRTPERAVQVASADAAQAGHPSVVVENSMENHTSYVENFVEKHVPQTGSAPFLPSGGGMQTPQTSAFGKSGLPISGSQEIPKREPNNNKKNKNNSNETNSPPTPPAKATDTGRNGRERRGKEWRMAKMQDMRECEEEIKARIEYVRLSMEYRCDMDLVDDYVALMTETMCSDRDYIYIAQDYRPIEKVRERLMKIDHEHMVYILDSVLESKTQITNIRAYMLSILFYAPVTIHSYYTARVNYDMEHDFWHGYKSVSCAAEGAAQYA